MPLTFPMPSCLHISSGNSFSFFNEHSSLFLLHKSPQSSKLFICSFSVSLTETIMVCFFFFLVKNSCGALHCHRAVAAPFFFFFCQKNFHRSTHWRKEIFAQNYVEHWCDFNFNVWQNVMVEASTMVIWCCESVMFLFFK